MTFPFSSAAHAFRWLIEPIAPDSFERDYFERKPCVIERADAAYYASLLTVDDLDVALGTHNVRPGEVGVVLGQDDIPRSTYTDDAGVVDPIGVTKLFDQGATITFNQFHRRIPTLADLCSALGQVFSSRLQTNIYLTPPDAQGFKPHWDTHDVFVLQVAGRKRWCVYDAKVTLPLKGQSFDPERDDPGEATSEFELGPGGAVYIPRGLMHSARSTSGEASLHITLGVTAFTWTDFLVESVAATALRESALRHALPLRFADDEFPSEERERLVREKLEVLVTRCVAEEVWQRFRKDVLALNTPLFTDLLTSRLRGRSITPASRWTRRRGLRVELRSHRDGCVLSLLGREVQFPAVMRQAVEFIASSDEFTIADLPDCPDDEGKVVLVRRLVGEGLLRPEGEAGTVPERRGNTGATERMNGYKVPNA